MVDEAVEQLERAEAEEEPAPGGDRGCAPGLDAGRLFRCAATFRFSGAPTADTYPFRSLETSIIALPGSRWGAVTIAV